MQAQHRLDLIGRLAAMDAEWHTSLALDLRKAIEQFRRAGFDTVRKQGRAHEAAVRAIEIRDEAARIGEAGLGPCGIEMPGERSVAFLIGQPAHDAGPEIASEAEFPGDVRDPRHLLSALGPGAIGHRSDRHRRGDAVANEVSKGVAVFEDVLLGRVGLAGANPQIVIRPDAPERALVTGIECEDGRVDVAERIEIDEARTNQGLAEIDRAIDRPLEAPAGMDDPVALEDDARLPMQHMPAAVEGQRIVGGKVRAHDRGSSGSDSRAAHPLLSPSRVRAASS